MKPNWQYFSEWILSRIEYAKRRDIKLTSKNIEKLNDVYTNWVYEYWGMNGLFKAAYGEHIAELIPQRSPILNFMTKTEPHYGIWHTPVIINGIHGVTFKKD